MEVGNIYRDYLLIAIAAVEAGGRRLLLVDGFDLALTADDQKRENKKDEDGESEGADQNGLAGLA